MTWMGTGGTPVTLETSQRRMKLASRQSGTLIQSGNHRLNSLARSQLKNIAEPVRLGWVYW